MRYAFTRDEVRMFAGQHESEFTPAQLTDVRAALTRHERSIKRSEIREMFPPSLFQSFMKEYGDVEPARPRLESPTLDAVQMAVLQALAWVRALPKDKEKNRPFDISGFSMNTIVIDFEVRKVFERIRQVHRINFKPMQKTIVKAEDIVKYVRPALARKLGASSS